MRDRLRLAASYGAATLSVCGAVQGTLLLQSPLRENPFVLFYGAIMFSAWVGGLGPGLVASALSALAVDYFFLHTFLTFTPSIESLVHLGAFGTVGLFITALNARRKHRLGQARDLLAREQMARAEAEALGRMKDEFLAAVSHELRTPLNAVLGWSHLLRNGKIDEATRTEAIESIERNARNQAQIIQDLLDMSRIIRGKLALERKPVDLATVIEPAIESVRATIQARQIHLSCVIEPSVGLVSGDAERLEQVMWNLLINAIKFTPDAGHIKVQLRRNGPNVMITVGDTGQGIAKEFLPHVFDPFSQADASAPRMHGGLGLGLAIVHHLTQLHGGVASVQSDGIGTGSTFTITLPRLVTTDPIPAGGHHAPGTNGSPVATQARLDGIHVLAVDDEPDARSLLRTVLKERGAHVTVCSSVAQALEALKVHKPDILVSDIGMPGEDGYDLIQQIRRLEDGNGSRLPAVALTAHARSEDTQRALEAGYHTHVSKPVEPTQLISVVAQLSNPANPGPDEKRPPAQTAHVNAPV